MRARGESWRELWRGQGRRRGAECCAGDLGPGLLQYTYNLALKLREFLGEDVAAGMEDEIEAWWEEINVAAKGLPHAALDAVTFVSFADYFADGEADTRGSRDGCIGGSGQGLRSEEPAHGCGLVFSGGGVDAEKVSVFLQARARQRLAALPRGARGHEEHSIREAKGGWAAGMRRRGKIRLKMEGSGRISRDARQ